MRPSPLNNRLVPPIRPTRWTRHELIHPPFFLPFDGVRVRHPQPSERKEASSRSFRPPPPPIGRKPVPAPATLIPLPAGEESGASAGGRARAPSLPGSLRAAGEAAHLDPPCPPRRKIWEGRGGAGRDPVRRPSALIRAGERQASPRSVFGLRFSRSPPCELQDWAFISVACPDPS
ncbi:hypothetical protein GQ55_8G045100 [Panicum hallii var. hallii]|uniref:Uncharacterized protein n=1 Tax=Panicum hallii var. hallii TaxID=1504633 RepID=A0A2T7CKP5_9POAL|nr:hypothetical protein GQ55_8G045100 [Panicum hallii var. hallii]